MSTITINLPTMFGDHHVVEVRRLLLELPGVADVYASSGFRVVEVQFDPSQTSQEAIESTLEEAGYLGELPLPAETGVAARSNGDKPFFRHTVAHAQTGKTVGFSQQMSYSGRPLWPCPGMGVLGGRHEEVNDA